MRRDENVAATMRDGAALRCDIYRPMGRGRRPVLVCRTPYGKRGEAFSDPYVREAEALARRGYIAVVQDTRGRYASDGEWRWLQALDAQTIEAEDGYDTVEWAADLDGSDGSVGMWGHSYAGFCALRAAGLAPPSLRAVFVSGITERLQDETYGIHETVYLDWLYHMAVDARRRAGDTMGPLTEEYARSQWRLERGKWLWWLPLGSLPDEVFSTVTPQLKAFLPKQHIDVWAFDDVQPSMTVPICHLTGWWDYVSNGTVAHFLGLRRRGPAQLSREHRLVVGPWAHDTTTIEKPGGAVDYGRHARSAYANEVAAWFDSQLMGGGTAPGEPRIRLFVLNENTWRVEDEWPVGGTEQQILFLHSSGRAATPHGDGRLSREEPADEPWDEYQFDPRDPVMSLTTFASQAVDQSLLDHRRDVLVYGTDTLPRDLVAIGDPECVLWVMSDAADTDFAVKLVEVRPNGLAINLSSAILRTRYRQGYDREEFLETGIPYELRIVMKPIGIRFRAGSRIRLDVTSSDFPNFDRNHNTGHDWWSDSELAVAHQRVLHDRDHPSRLVLPVLPA